MRCGYQLPGFASADRRQPRRAAGLIARHLIPEDSGLAPMGGMIPASGSGKHKKCLQQLMAAPGLILSSAGFLLFAAAGI